MKILFLIVFIFINLIIYAQPFHGENYSGVNTNNRAAGCSPPSESSFLELNNVKALIHTAGNLWQISGQNFCHYEVPKGSGTMALFTSALWLGGVDVNGQLKLAALRYREGQDYWTGPLTTTGDATVTPETCEEFDAHFRITKDEVKLFNEWFISGLEDQTNGTLTQNINFPDYVIPESILNWPAHGDISLGQDYYLAPFYDRDLDGEYDPINDGDYPWYDLNKEIDCKTSRTVTLFGDETLWWVMNDKGNIHTETGGDPIGMEIRAQAFAFATNNEINNSTFYNYELFNRSTQTLYNTYFGLMVDVALGGPNDDYVGCDVSRGLGYAYNGDAYDGSEQGLNGYGENPPAVGVDFFEGPYQDNDGFDNPLTNDYSLAQTQDGIPYPGLGIGYGDGIVDNERFGMRRFLYYNNIGIGNVSQTDPQTAQDYYAYLSGFWKDGTHFVYGGNGHPSDGEADPGTEADFMFPGTTDPLGWGTGGSPQPNWTEETSGNPPYDRRFAQSAGPFVLKPGAINNITVGVVWARANSGDPFQSVIELKKADDKAQALFDNCFEVLEGPNAPDLSIQEMENEIIISIYNPSTSNNKNEDYNEIDPEIVNVDGVANFDNKYHFQGYQVFQLKNNDVSGNELHNISKARLVFQTDIEDGVSKLVNYTYDDEVGASIPVIEVVGADEGISHSFSIKEDLFAQGDRKLVNHKQYYFMAISYAQNNFKTYIPNDPNALNGQQMPYLPSRKAAIGGIKAYEAIPHSPSPENGGTEYFVNYGHELPITQIDGIGNGGRWVELDTASENDILENNHIDFPSYISGSGPIEVKVIDPLNLIDANFKLFFTEDGNGELDSSNWYLVNLSSVDTVFSDQTIEQFNEQLIPEWGISVSIKQIEYESTNLNPDNWFTAPIGATISYSDSSKIWLSQVTDSDLNYPNNWIRSGTNEYNPADDDCQAEMWIQNPCYYDDRSFDDGQLYEGLLNGGIAPFRLAGFECYGMPISSPSHAYNPDYQSGLWNISGSQMKANFVQQHDVDIVITSDDSKWTKCPVFEMNDNENQTIGNADAMELRGQSSVDKNGVSANDGTNGMGWFPGYAIDVTTGERLNMAFSENSWLAGENGGDMKWNPTSRLVDNVGNPLFGGMHYVYVFGASNDMPLYDKGTFIYNKLNGGASNSDYNKIFENCQWIWEPMLEDNHTVLESDVRISVRINKPYEVSPVQYENNGLPAYWFSTSDIATKINVNPIATDALSQINIVPNPYYAYSKYETSILDNRVKITNLPEKCTITIFNISGQLVKQISKDNSMTSQDWDLKNHKGIPIAGGVYIFHIDVPGVGEKILKWYGSVRMIDLQDF
jgi:hypothetical protein